MTATSEVVTLEVDGFALQGWQSVAVTWSADAVALSFELAATNPGWSAEARRLRRSRQVDLYTTPDGEVGRFDQAGGDLLCAGYVDEYSASLGPGASHSVSLAGRSKTADAVDSEPANHETGSVENKDLVGVAQALDEWGLVFRADRALAKIPEVQRVPGESMFATLEREARRQGLLLIGQPDGSVLITSGAAGRHAGGLVEGQSPLEAFRLSDSMRLSFSEVIVRGQQAIGTEEENLSQEERAQNDGYGRHRPLIIYNEGSNSPEELKARAEWELARRNGARLSILAKVATWRDESGALWTPRRLVAFVSPSEEIDTDLAIQSVTFNQQVGEGEGSGTWADLTLVYPEALGRSE